MQTRVEEVEDCSECRHGIWIWNNIYHCKKGIKNVGDKKTRDFGGKIFLKEDVCPLSTKSQYIQQQIQEALGDDES